MLKNIVITTQYTNIYEKKVWENKNQKW